MTFNGSPCVVGDAVARHTAHPLLQQPLQLFPIEVLEQALEQVHPTCTSSFREAALQSRVVWLAVFHSITPPTLLPPQYTSPIRRFGRQSLCRVRDPGNPGPHSACNPCKQVRDLNSPRGTFTGLVDSKKA
jgi:hypothetical protein